MPFLYSPNPLQPYCSQAIDFNGLTVDLVFDQQTSVDIFVQAMIKGGALSLIKSLHVSAYMGMKGGQGQLAKPTDTFACT